MAHIQAQIRENSMELQDYLRELRDWEVKAKAKDQMLRDGSAAAPPSEVPPIRGQPQKGPEPGEAQAKTEANSVRNMDGDSRKGKNAASHTYDYFRDNWDKFDVDKALAEADDESPRATKPGEAPLAKSSSNIPIISPATISAPKQAKPASSSKFAFPDASESVPPALRKASVDQAATNKAPDAASEKEEGNRLFKAGRFREAFECYSRSLALGPTSVAYANRAMAALKLESFRKAEADCTAAIDLDGHYVKAYSRRGRARSHLENWLEAADDFEFALRLEPHNKELLHEYSAARTACQRTAKLSNPSTAVKLPVKTAQKASPVPLSPPSLAGQISSEKADRELERSSLGMAQDASGESKPEGESKQKPEGFALAPKTAVECAQEVKENRVDKVGRASGPISNEGEPHIVSQNKNNLPVEKTGYRPAVSGAHVVETGGSAQAEKRTLCKDATATRNGTPLELPGGHVADGGASSPSSSSPSEREESKKSPKERMVEANGSLAGATASSVAANGSRVNGDRPLTAVKRPLAVANAAAERLQRSLADHVAAPRTSYEFEAHWKGFKDDAAAKAKLLKTLVPFQLAPFFKESLHAPLLCDVLRVVARELLPGDAAFAADLLEGLSTVPRFAMTVMFVSSKDKQSLRELWDSAATDASIPESIRTRLASCRIKYRL